jgi:hypothetical protein
LKKRELRIGATITLRQWIGLMESLPVTNDYKPLSAQAAVEGCKELDVLAPNCKDYILSMLNHALDFMKRPQLV